LLRDIVKQLGKPPSSLPAWQRYGIALALTAAAVALRMSLNPVWGRTHNRHLVFFPTVMLVSWLGGFGPGVLSLVLCTVAIDYLWTEPVNTFFHFNAEVFLYLTIGFAICVVIQSLHNARARADAASQSRERVLAIVAHDLRNPLSAAQMALHRVRRLLGGGEDREQVFRRLTTVERAISRMDHLIRDLLDSTHIEQGQLALTMRSEPPDPIARDAVDLALPMAQERGISLMAELNASPDPILCDRDRILQVLGNLLGNALEFTPDRGRITLRTANAEEGVRFEVEDTGPGIKAEDLPHLFERYWKAESRGTGLGLFIADNVVRAHGGRIEVHSSPGRGALFVFTVPRAATPA
jgi:signal transduction histidine kinase